MKIIAAHKSESDLDSERKHNRNCAHSHRPNKETRKALKNAKKNLIAYDSIEDFFRSIKE